MLKLLRGHIAPYNFSNLHQLIKKKKKLQQLALEHRTPKTVHALSPLQQRPNLAKQWAAIFAFRQHFLISHTENHVLICIFRSSSTTVCSEKSIAGLLRALASSWESHE